ncbi:MAG: GTPase domain-containing protein [Legionella sp.]|uniref:GTPase domain-containing protein n=1 Tax=Legionella sp. TaxID=459 RepID=UPI00284358A3|nr:GTPase domain-containing protein [Legionella sp.]
MSQLNVVFWSEKNSGQSALVQALRAKEFSKGQNSTIGADRYRIQLDSLDEFHLWDISDSPDYALSYFHRAQVFVVCVDLSFPLNREQIENRARYIQHLVNDTPIVLVGTKTDLLSDDEKQARLQQFNELNMLDGLFVRQIITSAKDNDGIDELRVAAIEFAKKKQQLFWKTSSEVLFEHLNQLSEEKLTAIKSELVVLEEQFIPFDINDNSADTLQIKMNAIQNFNNRCEYILEGENAKLKKALISFSAGLAVAVLAAVVGFGVGFALGFWTGPGALFAGAATATATVYLSLSAVSGATVGGLIAYGLFKPSKEQIELEHFSKQLIPPTQHSFNL